MGVRGTQNGTSTGAANVRGSRDSGPCGADELSTELRYLSPAVYGRLLVRCAASGKGDNGGIGGGTADGEDPGPTERRSGSLSS